MHTHTIKIDTKEHQGPLQINLEFLERFKGDIKVSVHTHAKVSLDSYIWQFEDKKSMILRPVKAFDVKLLSQKQQKLDQDKNLWQPEAVFCQFFSITGCMFNLTAVFTEEAMMREKRKKMRENVSSTRNMRGKFQAMVQRRIEEAINVKREIALVNSEIAELKLNRRRREKANMDVDFVH